MKYPILSDKDISIIHNRSKNAYNEFCTQYHEVKRSNDLANHTPIVKSYYVNLKPLKKELAEDELDIDNIDFEIIKSIIAINEYHKYLNMRFDSEG